MPTATPYLVRVLDASWRADTNYDAGALKFHNNKYWQALQPSGPDNGGAKEPGTDGAAWADTSNITYSAGTGLSLTGTQFAVDTSWLASQMPSVPTYTAGTGISKSGTQFSVDTAWLAGQMPSVPTYSAGTGISLSGTQFSINTTWLAQQMPTVPTYTAGTGITLNGTQISVNASWLASQIPTPDTSQYLPLYFTADSLELHTFVPANAKTVRYAALEADGSGTSGLTLTMARDIGSTASMSVTGTATDCSAYANHSVTFTLGGVGNQTEIAAMVVFE